MICDNCGEEDATTKPREDGMAECDRCWAAALEHGHAHGLHQDADGEPVSVEGCPICRPTSCLTCGETYPCRGVLQGTHRYFPI